MDTSVMKNTGNGSGDLEAPATVIELKPGYCALAIGPESTEFAYDVNKGIGYFGLVLLGVVAAIETENKTMLDMLVGLGSKALLKSEVEKNPPRVAQLEE